MGQHLILSTVQSQLSVKLLISVCGQKIRIVVKPGTAVIVRLIGTPLGTAVGHTMRSAQERCHNAQCKHRQQRGQYSLCKSGPQRLSRCRRDNRAPAVQQIIQHRNQQERQRQKKDLAPDQITQNQQCRRPSPGAAAHPHKQRAASQCRGDHSIMDIQVMGQQQPRKEQDARQQQRHTPRDRFFPGQFPAPGKDPCARQPDTAPQEQVKPWHEQTQPPRQTVQYRQQSGQGIFHIYRMSVRHARTGSGYNASHGHIVIQIIHRFHNTACQHHKKQ